MVALLIAMAVSAIWLATMLPAWRQQAVRQREQDLIFRGQQYARGIALYYLANGCTLPRDVDMLISRHYLRKKWKDPIANDDFVPLIAGGIQASTSGTQQTGRAGAPAGNQLVGLFGVSSKSTDTSITLFQNQQQYSLWSFRYTDALQLMGRTPGCNSQGQPNAPPTRGGTPPGGPNAPGTGTPRGGGPGGPPPNGPGGGRPNPGSGSGS